MEHKKTAPKKGAVFDATGAVYNLLQILILHQSTTINNHLEKKAYFHSPFGQLVYCLLKQLYLTT